MPSTMDFDPIELGLLFARKDLRISVGDRGLNCEETTSTKDLGLQGGAGGGGLVVRRGEGVDSLASGETTPAGRAQNDGKSVEENDGEEGIARSPVIEEGLLPEMDRCKSPDRGWAKGRWVLSAGKSALGRSIEE